MNRAETIAKGQRADRELELTREVLAKMRSEALEAIIKTAAGKPAEIERQIARVHVIDDLQNRLGQLVQGARLEENLAAQTPGA